ncbi:MAG TPA: penicillin-binding protein, partial [Nocardioides sp.]
MSSPHQESGPPPGTVLKHLGVMAACAAVLGVLVAGLAIPFVGMVGIAAKDVSEGMDNLPQELEAEPLDQKTRILDVHGNTIAQIYDENRINVPLRQISRTMVESIVSIEDYRFYQHGALDLKGTLRAFVTNQTSDSTQGGSSITQQMVKLTLLSQADTKEEAAAATESTYGRKLRELRYAIAFEKSYSKDWILERYLNIAYFGDGAYGIQAAARHYFGVNAKDLDLRQSALLAGIVKNPTGYDPTNNPERALARRNVVLDRMAELSVISERKAERTKKKGLGLDIEASPNGCVGSTAPFFCDYVLNYLYNDPSLGETRADRKRLIRSAGLTIRTTLDSRFQRAADAATQEYVDPTDQAIGGLAMVEPRSGDVRALSQSRPMGKDKSKGETFLNYVVPQEYGDSAGFQAGSTFKPFVLAAAIKQKFPLRSEMTVPSEVTLPMGQFRTCGGPYTSTDSWTVGNYDDTGGTYDLYTGTQNSVNTFFARLTMITGICEPYQLAKQMGIRLTDPDRERVPSFTLGTASTSPLEMAEAYATFAGRGLHCEARPVTAIEDANGNELKAYDEKCTQVLEEPVADAVNDILKGVMEPGGFGQYISTSQEDAGKTGTTQNGMAVWFAGYTPNVATAAMIAGANSDGTWLGLEGRVVGGRYISSASGSGVAGPMWGQAMGVVEQYLDDVQFTTPDFEALRGTMVSVPSTGGMSPAQARKTLEEAGFNVFSSGSYVYSDVPYPYGTVAYTDPGYGSSVPEGSVIALYLSNGEEPPPPPPPPAPEPPPSTGGGGGGGTGGGTGGGD